MAPVLRTLPSGWRNTVMPRSGPGTPAGRTPWWSATPASATAASPSRSPARGGEGATDPPRTRRRGGRGARRRAAGDAAPRLVKVIGTGGGWIEFEDGGRRHRLHVFRHGSRVWVQGPDGDVELAAVPRFPGARTQEGVTGGLAAPMPGTVSRSRVAAGDTVAAGQLLMIVEAMKMEHRITAPHAGVVREIRARPGEQVAAGDLLAVLDQTESGP